MKPRHSALRKEFLVLVLTVSAVMLPALASADPTTPQGGIFYSVNTTSDTVVIGACQNGNPGCSLRGAIQTANSHPGADGIGIDLPAGSVINLTGVLPNITESVSISGPGANMVTVRRNTGGNYRIFNVTTTGAVSFSGLTINGGSVTDPNNGGGIQNASSGTVNVTNCVLSDNHAAGSGGFNGVGGGIFNNSTGTVNVTNSTLSGNSALNGGDGGGIYNSNGGSVNVTLSTLSGNFTSGGGGGMFNEGGGTVRVDNSTLSGNSSAGGFGPGGGIYNSNGGTLAVINSTLSGNFAGSGGGISNSSGVVHVESSIIALNSAQSPNPPDVSGSFGSYGFNLIGKVDGSTGFTEPTDQTGTVASPLDPKLDPNGLQNNGGPTQTIALLWGSPAIDKGFFNGLTYLSSAINNSTTAINVDDGGRIPAGVGYTILIDSEQMVVTNKAGNMLTVTRGANGTTAAPHSAFAILYPAFDQRGTGFLRNFDYPFVTNATDGNGTDIGAFELLTPYGVSRKVHGATNFDLPLTGTAGIECRTGGANGDHQVIVTFPSPVSLTSASVTTGNGSVSSFTVNGAQVTVNLINVANAQTITVTLFGVNDGTTTSNVSVPMGLLLGDTTGNGSVNASDVSQTKARSGQTVDATNFRSDVTVNGSINASDVSLVKSKSGTALP